MIRFITFIFISLSLLSPGAWGKSKSAPPAEVASGIVIPHAQLVKLSPELQAQYIEALRTEITRIEEHAGQSLAMMNRSKGLWAQFLMAESNADPAYMPRCMYGGFVVYGKECEPVNSMTIEYPIDINIDGLEKAGSKDSDDVKKASMIKAEVKLSCPAGRGLCNPFVFGVQDNRTKQDVNQQIQEGLKRLSVERKKQPRIDLAGDLAKSVQDQVKPYCVPSGRNTSRQCYNESRQQELKDGRKTALQVALANSAEWDKFRSSVNLLCDAENIKVNPYLQGRAQAQKDVVETCEQSRKRIEELVPQVENNPGVELVQRKPKRPAPPKVQTAEKTGGAQ